MPIEVKLGLTPPDIRGLEASMRDLGLEHGYVVNLSAAPVKLGPNVTMCGLRHLLERRACAKALCGDPVARALMARCGLHALELLHRDRDFRSWPGSHRCASARSELWRNHNVIATC